MIHVGNQTSCWTAAPGEPFEYAVARGFDAFEWFPDKKPEGGWDEGDLDSAARRQIRERAQAAGIRLSVHARWQADLLALDSSSVIWKDVELARNLGAALLNVHLCHEHGVAAFVDAILPLIQKTAEAGLELAIENTPLHPPGLFNDLFARLRALAAIDTRHVGMCLDVGHANLCEATRNDYLGFVDQLDPQVPIVHLHLHENWGDADTHLPLFTGPASQNDAGIRGLLARLARRNFSGSIILEQWPHPPSLLDQARERLLGLWESSVASAASPPLTNRQASAGPPRSDRARAGEMAGDFAALLAAGNRRCRSWREKLDFVHGLLADERRTLTSDELIDLATYLRFLGTGEIPCAEDGRHFRPAHHANLASQILARLARLASPDNAFILRKIYPWLPSSAPAFQRPEPLTRIRDIAHRNDIDPALKREIKNSLQNKLHRCAGPEDLATSAALLKRITTPGAGYSPAFVEQFQIFHRELQEFFNAPSLEDRLAALASTGNAGLAELIGRFRSQKPDTSPAGRLAAIQTLTALRTSLLGEAAPGPGPETQPLVLADIALEDFAFVLVSDLINAAEGLEPGAAWNLEVNTLTLTVRNLALSGVNPGETRAVEAELRAWGTPSPSASRDELLRLKASVLRCRRLAEDFAAQTVALFARRAETLGRALGVDEYAVRVFSESDIRAHIIFQAAKLVTSLLRQLRHKLNQPAWDVLVSGRAAGRARAVDSLDDLDHVSAEPVVAILSRAAGDEEIPKHVVAMVVAHEMPHLSHLAVRARQAGVVFTACEELPEFERLQHLDGQIISFQALPDQVAWGHATRPDPRTAEPQPPAPAIPEAQLQPASTWLPIDEVTSENSGGKANGLRRLRELARQPGTGFSTPAALAIPFGVMETQLAMAPAVKADYHRLADQVGSMAPTEVAAATQALRGLVQQLPVPEDILVEVARTFAPGSRLAVRSSANCEDAEGLAGAGLYDSVLNAAPSNVAPAILTVWASLWTRRAALSRRQAGIPHGRAHMAVIIQEMVIPEFSFVLHTVNPVNRRTDEICAEIVVGLGDTLASASTRGTPYRLVCHKASGVVETLAFANFSQASRPASGGGLERETVDYSRINLSRDNAARETLGRKLAALGQLVEKALGQPQDIEGAVTGGRIYLVQARPQPGLPPQPKS